MQLNGHNLGSCSGVVVTHRNLLPCSACCNLVLKNIVVLQGLMNIRLPAEAHALLQAAQLQAQQQALRQQQLEARKKKEQEHEEHREHIRDEVVNAAAVRYHHQRHWETLAGQSFWPLMLKG